MGADSFDGKAPSAISLKSILLRFKWRILLTLALVLVDSLLGIFFPLVIGIAINGLLEDQYHGIYALAALGLLSLFIGCARRFYDTRIYAGIYCRLAPELVKTQRRLGHPVSAISARATLLTEFVEFLENSLPQVVNVVIGLIGILIIVFAINLAVFTACLSLLLLIAIVYTLTGKWNYGFNAHYNAVLEQQVDTLRQGDMVAVDHYFRRLMKWNIKLSDLETGNYFFVWLGIIALFIYTPISAVSSGTVNYGMVFSLLLSVFDYVDKVATLPLFIQQIIRLREISHRLAK